MTDQHPITPPPELIEKWYDEWLDADELIHLDQAIAAKAARWGADQELEACVQLTRDNDGYDAALGLRAARRPKQPSLKRQALDAWGRFTANGHTNTDEMIQDFALIRRALEALPDELENQ